MAGHVCQLRAGGSVWPSDVSPSLCPCLLALPDGAQLSRRFRSRPDATLQSIVYKTVPGLHRDEMQRRQLFYDDKPDAG